LGDSIRLNPIISNASSFSWTPATGISNTGIANPFFKPISTTTYILTASNNSCSTKDTVTIVVNNISLEVGPDKNICPGDSIQIIPTFSNVDNFSWLPTSGVSNSALSSPYFKPTTTTNYILTATNSSCTIKDTVRIQVNGINLELGVDRIFCPGDSIKINPTIVNANNFSWLPITGLSNPYISNPNFKHSVTTKYILTASNNFCTLKDSITIQVNNLNLELGLNRNICPGDSVQLNPIFTDANNFLWTPNLGISSPTISNPILKPDTTTTYILTANNTSCSISDTILIQVNNLRIQLGPNKNICLGDSIRINPFTSNVSSFNWYPSVFVSNNSIENPFLKPTITTKFYLDVSNSSCSLKDSVEITVNTISLEIGSDKTICLGDSIIINPLAGNGNFLWSPAIGLNTTNSKNTIAKPISNIKYYLNHTNGACSMIDSVTISVNSVTVELGTDKSVCLGDSIRINPLTTNSSSYSWSPINGISDPLIKNPYFNPNISTKYFLLVSDGLCSAKDSISIETKILSLNAGMDKSICLGDSIQLNAIAGNGNYTWYPKTEISDTSISNPIVQPKNDRKYFISYAENGCHKLDSILVMVRQIGLEVGTDKTICLGDSIQILANQFGGSNLIWSPAIGLSDINIIQPWAKPVSTQKYKLKIDDGVCFKSDSLTITILDKNLISKSNDTMICFGNSVQLNISGGTNLQWLNPYNLDLSNIFKPIASPLIDTIYIVRFSSNGCWFFDSIAVKVNKSPFIDAGRDTFHCFDKYVEINGNKGNSFESYWQSNPYFSDTLKLDQIVNIKNQYKFILIGKSNGCLSFDTLVVNERPKVTADFTVFPESGLTPLEINLKNTSTNYTNFFWLIDGTSINGLDSDTNFVYKNKPDLNIHLTVSDSFGCSDTLSKTVKIISEPIFKIPNVFTPNGDSTNDYFQILFSQEAFKYVEYEIYNRWGQLLHTTKMPGGKWWDGYYNDKECPEGVYFYIAFGEAINGKMFNAHGTVTLIR
jgi:gliding motility-associated-like protein